MNTSPPRRAGVLRTLVGAVALSAVGLQAPLAVAGSPADFTPRVEGQTGFGPPVVDATGVHVALTRWDRAGLWAWDRRLGVIDAISDARGAGFHPTWDGESLLFKQVVAGRQSALRWRGAFVELLDSGRHVSQPTRLAGARRLLLDVGDVDLIEPDPAGERLAWDDEAGVLHVRTVSTGFTRTLDEAGPGSHPAWSSDGSFLLHHSVGTITVVEASTGRRVASLDGRDPSWVPGTGEIVYASVVTGSDLGWADPRGLGPYEVESSTVWSFDATTGASRLVLDSPSLHARYPTPIGESGDLLFVDTIEGDLWRLSGTTTVREWLAGEVDDAAPPPPPATSRTEVPVPYMHQLWDTPDDFDGGWSCGPTSCLQTLAAFSALPDADITVSWPSSHTSHWGWYVPNTYAFSGHTYDAWGEAAGGQCQGAHGFICREYGGAVWSYMTTFMGQHGVDSAQVGTDYNSVVSEINAGYPMYASASVLGYGHILVVRGYVSEDGSPIHTIVVNDPYGNAGSGDWGNNDGEDIVYDWPGYNNGNLEIEVAQLFTARGVYPATDPGPDTGTDSGSGSGTPVDTATSDSDAGTSPDSGSSADSADPPPRGPAGRPGGQIALDEVGGCQTVPRGAGTPGALGLVAGLALWLSRSRGRPASDVARGRRERA